MNTYTIEIESDANSEVAEYILRQAVEMITSYFAFEQDADGVPFQTNLWLYETGSIDKQHLLTSREVKSAAWPAFEASVPEAWKGASVTLPPIPDKYRAPKDKAL